jgi:drug/metabolite transporter (DMT)-like permease
MNTANTPFAGITPEARGALLVVVATGLFAYMDGIAKLLSQRHDPMMVVWARYTGQAALVALMVAPRLRSVLRANAMRLQLLRSAFFFGTTVAAFFAFSMLPLATVTAVFQVAPLAITALAALVLRETVGPRRWMGVAVGFAGAMVIIRPGSAVFEPASLLALVAAMGFAAYTITTRVLSQRDGFWTTYLYSAVVGAALSTLYLPLVWTTPSTDDVWLMVLMAVIGTVGQLVLVYAFTSTASSALAPFTYFSLIAATVLGFLMFGELPDLATVLGATIIVGSGLYVWRREQQRARATERERASATETTA